MPGNAKRAARGNGGGGGRKGNELNHGRDDWHPPGPGGPKL